MRFKYRQTLCAPPQEEPVVPGAGDGPADETPTPGQKRAGLGEEAEEEGRCQERNRLVGAAYAERSFGPRPTGSRNRRRRLRLTSTVMSRRLR